jgi:competence protein ComEC
MRRSRYAALIVIASAFCLWTWSASQGPAEFTIDVLDAGQGDAILVHEGRTQALIDGGPDRLVLSSLGASMPLGDRTIEIVMLSHPDQDHIGGLFDVLSRYDVRTLVFADAWKQHRAAGRLAAFATERGTKVVYVATGDVVRLTDDIRFDILWPDVGDVRERVNDYSIVASLDGPASGIEMLLTGDVEASAEAELVPRGSLHATILKSPHHGSRSSSTTSFLDAVAPTHAVISVGEGNSYGHPSSSVLLRYASAGIAAWRTDLLGSIRITFEEDGTPRAWTRSWHGWRASVPLP